MISRFRHLFTGVNNPIQRMHVAEHTIYTGELITIFQHLFHHSPFERQVIQEQVKGIVREDVISESHGAWSYPGVLATTRVNAEDLKTMAASMQGMQSRLLSLDDKLSLAPTQWLHRNGRTYDGRSVCHYSHWRGHLLRQFQTRKRDRQRERRG